MGKKAFILLILIFILSCSGCWNRRDPEDLAIVIAMVFHWEEAHELYHVYVQIANPLGLGRGGSNGGGEQNPFWTLSARGHTPIGAVKNLALKSPREITLSHNIVVVFTADLARQGIGPVLDLLEREKESRLVAVPAVTRGDPEDLISAELPMEDLGGQAFRRAFLTTHFEKSAFPMFNLFNIINYLERPGQDIIMGTIEVFEMEGEPPMRVKLGAGAFFRGDKLVGWYDDRQVQGWHWISKQVFRVPLIVRAPGSEHLIDVEIFQTSSRNSFTREKDGIKMLMDMDVKGRVQAFDPGMEVSIEAGDFMQSLERRVAEVVRKDIEMAIFKAQEHGADVFGFGNLIFRQDPALWQELKEKWPDIFSQLEFKVQVEASILQTGLIEHPVNIR